jgi:hypothetical protein
LRHPCHTRYIETCTPKPKSLVITAVIEQTHPSSLAEEASGVVAVRNSHPTNSRKPQPSYQSHRGRCFLRARHDRRAKRHATPSPVWTDDSCLTTTGVPKSVPATFFYPPTGSVLGRRGVNFGVAFACDVRLADYELRLRRDYHGYPDARVHVLGTQEGRTRKLNSDEDDQACLFYGVGPMVRMTALGFPYSQADHEKNWCYRTLRGASD